MTSLSITTTLLATGVVVLILRGPLGLLHADSVRDAILRAIGVHRPAHLELDLADVVDVHGSAALIVVETAEQAAAGDTSIVVRRASAEAREHLLLAGGEHLLR
jgi:hypothetical protein